jgi:hypothetical protein
MGGDGSMYQPQREVEHLSIEEYHGTDWKPPK